MRSIILYIYFFFYLVYTILMKVKVNIMKKRKSKEEVEMYVHKTVSKWAKNVLKVIGVKVNIKGLENLPDSNCLFVSNHQGNADFLAILSSIDKPMGFIAKKEIKNLRIITSWMKQIHCVFIDRTNIRASLKAINEGAQNLKNGYSMLVFPEGTRSKGPKLGEFKKGSMKLASKAPDVPIVPITLNGSYKIFEEGNGKLKKGIIDITISKPIYYKNLAKEEKADLAQICRSMIQKNLD